MDLAAKIRTLPVSAGVYLYKNAEGQVIYVGKANNLRSRVSSYFHEGRVEDAKTGSLVREAVDVDYIVVANSKEALALENHLIKQKQPRFNILLRGDKTYPYVKLTLGERFPRVYVTRRLRKDGSSYYGPYFPANLAYRIVNLIHRHFLIPSCKVDLNRFHPRPCLQYYIARCLGPCVEGLTTPEAYQEAVRDVKLFLEGRPAERSPAVSEPNAELWTGKDARHSIDLPGSRPDSFNPGEFLSALLKQLYIGQPYVPRNIYVPIDFEDRESLEDLLSDQLAAGGGRATRVNILVPQRGDKRSLIDLAGNNAKQSYDQRFRVMKPNAKAIQEALQDALGLPEIPRRIECFDISHIQWP